MGSRTALVVEGGGMRGIFAAGVLDAFLQARFNPFDLLIGVSAGAITLASYLSGQYQRYYRIISGPMSMGELISFRRFLKGGHLMDLDWLWRYAAEHEPLNTKAATSDPAREYLVGVTDALTGKAVFIRPEADTLSGCLKASSALPVFYRDFVEIQGRKVADGGVSDPLPVREAYLRGAREITVIRTRPANDSKRCFPDSLLAFLFLRDYPSLRARIHDLHRVYEDALRFIKHPPQDASVTEIAPPEALRSRRLSMNSGSIEADYRLGRKTGDAFLSNLLKMRTNRQEES
jgi:predicted patatin/cPLA2 family phospholipase